MEYLHTESRGGYTLTVTYEQWADDPTNWGNFEIAQWRDIDGIDIDTREISDELKAKLADGRAFWVDKYEHSGSSYTLHGEGMNDRWDTTRQWGIIIFSDEYATNFDDLDGRREMARQDLATYTQWANGEVYRADIVDDETGEWIDGAGDCYGLDETIADGQATLERLAGSRRDAARAKKAGAYHE